MSNSTIFVLIMCLVIIMGFFKILDAIDIEKQFSCWDNYHIRALSNCYTLEGQNKDHCVSAVNLRYCGDNE